MRDWIFNMTNRKLQQLWPRFTVMQMLCFGSVHYRCITDICEKGQWLLRVCNFETFRITVAEWETFSDHLPRWLAIICIRSRDLQADLTCGKVCAPKPNSRTFPNKLFFFPGCLFIINVYRPTFLSGTGTTTLFQGNLNSFTFSGLAPFFLISDSRRIALRLHSPLVTLKPFLQSEIKMQGDQWVTPVAFRDTCM